MATPRSSPSDSAAGLLGLQEAADQLGVHYMTAYRYVPHGPSACHSDRFALVCRPARSATRGARERRW